jgi:hypothetical protein
MYVGGGVLLQRVDRIARQQRSRVRDARAVVVRVVDGCLLQRGLSPLRCGRHATGHGLPGETRRDRDAEDDRGGDREADDRADDEHAATRGNRLGFGRLNHLLAVELAQHRRRARGVVAVEPLVRLVVDVAGVALGLEIVERADQELAPRLELLARFDGWCHDSPRACATISSSAPVAASRG